jgi:5-(aminomethyl)-3-furanmethanol phosphate kinase
MASRRPIVVKLGGSFAYSDHLRDWIEALAACAGRVVIVPGGGPFADAVRLAQIQMRFDDKAAHHMAVLATDIAQTWNVTSDSLAAWLAGKIDADRLLLVKHAKLSHGRARLKDLIAARIVDDEFARFLQMMPLPVSILGPSDHDTAVVAIHEGTSVGIAVQ